MKCTRQNGFIKNKQNLISIIVNLFQDTKTINLFSTLEPLVSMESKILMLIIYIRLYQLQAQSHLRH